MINLWEETTSKLNDINKTWDDVLYVYGTDFQITKENFKEVAKRTFYDDGYGSSEVPYDLKLYGHGFILYRYEYDGSECWEYIDTRYPRHLPIEEVKILAYGHVTLTEIKELGSKYDN